MLKYSNCQNIISMKHTHTRTHTELREISYSLQIWWHRTFIHLTVGRSLVYLGLTPGSFLPCLLFQPLKLNTSFSLSLIPSFLPWIKRFYPVQAITTIRHDSLFLSPQIYVLCCRSLRKWVSFGSLYLPGVDLIVSVFSCSGGFFSCWNLESVVCDSVVLWYMHGCTWVRYNGVFLKTNAGVGGGCSRQAQPSYFSLMSVWHFYFPFHPFFTFHIRHSLLTVWELKEVTEWCGIKS